MNSEELVANILLMDFEELHAIPRGRVYRWHSRRWQAIENSRHLSQGFLAVVVRVYHTGTVDYHYGSRQRIYSSVTVECDSRIYKDGRVITAPSDCLIKANVIGKDDCSDLYRQIVDVIENADKRS